jgi:DNA-binding XRE family transcriptional regulator
MMTLPEKIKVLRKQRQWSQDTMAIKLNISLNSYGALERGEIDIKFSRIVELARIFDLTVSDLFNDDTVNLSRRKEDKCRRFDDISVEDYHLLKFEKYKLEIEAKTKRLEEYVKHQEAILQERDRLIQFLESSIKGSSLSRT